MTPAQDKVVVSVADSDAVFGRDKQKVYRPLYNVQTVCDLASEMILSYEVFAQVSDSGTLQTMLDRLIQNGVLLQSLLADAGYPTGEDLAYCHQQGVVNAVQDAFGHHDARPVFGDAVCVATRIRS